eukprot:TRINITY_DN5427_c0_g1_i1.p1 TRINITY_DN5427_c0_g1~~TRINITY_DN5427_c0_g1_i1.p1  ORF type:complete len:955 (+),score=202.57 TRINITY_DN5427_c0_g1_i1:107-2971(+)
MACRACARPPFSAFRHHRGQPCALLPQVYSVAQIKTHACFQDSNFLLRNQMNSIPLFRQTVGFLHNWGVANIAFCRISTLESYQQKRQWRYVDRRRWGKLWCCTSQSLGGGDDSGGTPFSGGGGSGDGSGSPRGAPVKTGFSERPDEVQVIVLDVGGMSCGGCAASVKNILESQPEVATASVNLATETAIIWPVPEVQTEKDWQKILGEKLAYHLTSCGFRSCLRDAKSPISNTHLQKKMEQRVTLLKETDRRLVMSWALGAVCLLGHASHLLGKMCPAWLHIFHSTGFQMALSLIALFGPGQKIIIDGWKSLQRRAPNMNTLVGLGAVSSFVVSSVAAAIPSLGWKAFFEEPVMLLAFVLLGRSLEERARLKASSDMTSLLDSLPEKAHLVIDSSSDNDFRTVEIPCGSLSAGDTVIVLPGEHIPADGIVRGGKSTIDESSLTGEPLPVLKQSGDQVIAGAMNFNGTLTIEVRRPGGETVMSDIVQMVEEAQNRHAPIQRLSDKVAGHFSYGVMAFSVATFAFWSLFGAKILPSLASQGSVIQLALQLSCNVLVIACPCALGLATPTAVLVGTSLGAKQGLLIRGGDILEQFSAVDTFVFDKTGTLTVGKPMVTKVVANRDAKLRDSQHQFLLEDEILSLAAAVECNSLHPIAKAVVEAARAAGCKRLMVNDGTFQQEPGYGATAIVGERRISVGTVDWLQRHGVNHESWKFSRRTNETVIYVGVDDYLAGTILMVDNVRTDAAQMVQYLTRMGIISHLLSGDKQTTADSVAKAVGIETNNVHASMKPGEKGEFIAKLQEEKKVVAMVGDGINDAAALAQSDVGIAMGGGVGAAREVASIVLMGDKLTQICDALGLSKLTMKKIKQNLWWAFMYNIIGIPIAAGVLLPLNGTMLTPSLAGAMMGISSLGVMANSLMLHSEFKSKAYVSSGATLTTNLNDHLDVKKGSLSRQNG